MNNIFQLKHYFNRINRKEINGLFEKPLISPAESRRPSSGARTSSGSIIHTYINMNPMNKLMIYYLSNINLIILVIELGC